MALTSIAVSAIIDDSAYYIVERNVPDGEVGGNSTQNPDDTSEGAADSALDKASDVVNDAKEDVKDAGETVMDTVEDTVGTKTMGIVIAILIAVAIIILIVIMIPKTAIKATENNKIIRWIFPPYYFCAKTMRVPLGDTYTKNC